MGNRFTSEKLRDVLVATCTALGLDPVGARLLRFTNNAVYALVSAPVVIRIVASTRLRHRVGTVVAVARHFERHGVPAIKLLGGVEQPMHVDGHLVTAWHEVLGEGEREFLLERCAEVEAALAMLDFPLPSGLVHGDAYPGNVIPGPDGPVLCDFDSSGVGPPEWDLTPLAVGYERFGDPPGDYRRFADAYGFDVTTWPGYPVPPEMVFADEERSVLSGQEQASSSTSSICRNEYPPRSRKRQ